MLLTSFLLLLQQNYENRDLKLICLLIKPSVELEAGEAVVVAVVSQARFELHLQSVASPVSNVRLL